MNDRDGSIAHEVSELLQETIVQVGAAMLLRLTDEQREYVLAKAHDEFRFWRIEGELKELDRRIS